MIINLRLIEKCNYNCEYCTMHSNKKTIFTYEKFALFIKKIMEYEKFAKVFIYGGEPFLYDIEILKKIIFLSSIYNLKIIFQTNLSDQSFAKIKTLLKLLKNKSRFYINASYHQDFENFNNFLKKLIFLNAKNILNEIAFMDEEKNYDQYFELKERFNKVEFCPLINGNVLFDHDKNIASKSLINLEKKDIFKKLNNDYHFKLNYYHWKNNDCNNYNQKCYIAFHEIHYFNDKIYYCLNDAVYDKNFINNEAFNFKNYQKSIICPYKKCFFDMQYFDRNYKGSKKYET